MNLVNILPVAVMALFTATVQAKICTISDVHVTQMFQHTDGVIFIDLDAAGDCGCSQSKRVAFHKNDDENFYLSASLAAMMARNKVMVQAEDGDGNCPIHGNTAKLRALYVSAN